MSEPVIQTTKGFGFIFIHSSLDDAGLSTAEFRVYAHLSRRASSMEDAAYPSIETIAKICRIHPDTARACIQTLIDRKMLEKKERPGRTSFYFLMSPKKWLFPDQKNGVDPSLQIGGVVDTPPSVSGGHPSLQTRVHPPETKGDEGNPCKGNPKEGVQDTKSRKPMARPTLGMVQQECLKVGLPESEAEGFVAFYESNGWKVGRNPMKSWTAAVINWRKRWEEKQERGNGHIQRLRVTGVSPL